MNEEKMKVAIISTTPPPVGGISRWTAKMLNMKLPHGWEITLVDDKPIDRENFGDKIELNYLNEIKRALRVWRDLDRTLRDSEIKVVHACPIATLPSLISAYVYSVISHKYKKKFIAHFRCTIPNMIHSKLQIFFLKRVCRNSDFLMLLNRQTENYVKQYCNTTMEVVPNFVEINNTNQDRKISDTIKTAVYVGGVTEEKGCKDIIEIAKHFPDITFNLIGKSEARVRDCASDINNVHFLGLLEPQDVKIELDKADVFLFLSKYPGEGFSNALVEAMGAGLPCLVSDWAANADMIENKGGFVIPINSPLCGVEKLKCMQDMSIRQQMSDWNVEKVWNTYTAPIVTRKYVEIYEKVISYD